MWSPAASAPTGSRAAPSPPSAPLRRPRRRSPPCEFGCDGCGGSSLIITQAIADGWLEELTPAELAASLVMVTAEDRNRDRPRPRRRLPTSGAALAQKRLRIIYYRFSAREKERGEENLRPLSTDYVNFTYDWCSGLPLTELQAPVDVELGDAVKALKGLYSALRQVEWAVTERPALRKLVLKARESLERDLITRV